MAGVQNQGWAMHKNADPKRQDAHFRPTGG
jgi:hypothetical protein